jgi:hypothetical protein
VDIPHRPRHQWLALVLATACTQPPVSATVSPATEARPQTLPSVASNAAPQGAPEAVVNVTPDSAFADPRTATRAFVEALVAKDVARLLHSFSKSRPFSIVECNSRRRIRATPEKFAAGMAPEGDYRGLMFGDDDLDNIRYWAAQAGPWTEFKHLTFGPELQRDPPVFVRWIKEKDRFVVDELSFPF